MGYLNVSPMALIFSCLMIIFIASINCSPTPRYEMIDVKDDLDSFEDQDVYQQRPFVTKRALDKMKYYGGLGKRLSLSELLAERVDEIEDAKRARIAEKKLDKLKYYGGLGKRLDRLRYMGSLGK